MRKHAVNCFSCLDPGSSFDFWHCHIDWEGKADHRPENRKVSILLGYEIFKMAEAFKSTVNRPVQCWWFIHQQSSDDAVYLHSPNANGMPFPYEFEGVAWGKQACELLSEIVDASKFKVGVLVTKHSATYVVTSSE